MKARIDPFEELFEPGPRRPVRIRGADLLGIEARAVDIEASVHGDQHAPPRILGLPDAAVREAYHRVHTAFRSLGWTFPRGQIVVNLAPASTRKGGSGFDLAIALALATLTGAIAPGRLRDGLFVGELGLDGALRPVRGILPILELCVARGIPRLFCPDANASLAQRVGADCEIVPLRDLAEALAVCSGQAARAVPTDVTGTDSFPRAPAALGAAPDLARVRGQASAREALKLAAVGGHHLLLSGPPGCGKTLLARCLPGILPDLPREHRLELARIHSAFASIDDRELSTVVEFGHRPFRAPHHTTSFAGLVGGGQPIQPGEITRAHHGVLFLDELPEFSRSTLEAMRQPLEEGQIALRRAGGAMTLPARFQLVVAMNPCPCGMLGHPSRPCRDTPRQIANYRARISGPLLDRIDIQHALYPVDPETLLDDEADAPCSLAVRAEIEDLHALTRDRNGGCLNASLDEASLRRQLAQPARRLLLERGRGGLLSARAIIRILRVARSAADIAGTDVIDDAAVATALHYRLRFDGS